MSSFIEEIFEGIGAVNSDPSQGDQGIRQYAMSPSARLQS